MKTNMLTKLLPFALAGALTVPAFAADLSVMKTAYEAPSAVVQTDTCDALSSSSYQYAIQINGEVLDATACIMVPMRAVAEPLGFSVTWNSGSVRLDNGTIHTDITIGVDRYVITTSNPELVGMSAPFSLGAAPYMVDGVTYVPLGLFTALLRDEDAVRLEDGQIIIQTEDAEIPNPFVDCSSMKDAADIAGFSMTLPSRIPNWVEETTFRAMTGSMLEVTYRGGDQELRLRKAVGSDDISGDYQSYDSSKTVTVHGVEVTYKGNDGKVMNAVWSTDGYSYSLSAPAGMTEDTAAALIQEIA